MTKCRAATIAPTRRWKAKSTFWVPGPANGGSDFLVAPPEGGCEYRAPGAMQGTRGACLRGHGTGA
jgi:hypothetical protein